MSDLITFLQVYLVIGVIYGVYIKVATKSSFGAMIINILGGPIALLFIAWTMVTSLIRK